MHEFVNSARYRNINTISFSDATNLDRRKSYAVLRRISFARTFHVISISSSDDTYLFVKNEPFFFHVRGNSMQLSNRTSRRFRRSEFSSSGITWSRENVERTSRKIWPKSDESIYKRSNVDHMGRAKSRASVRSSWLFV